MSKPAQAARLGGQRSQRVFDVFLRALAEPGTIRSLPMDQLPADVPPAAWLPLALADVDVGVSVDGDPQHELAVLVSDVTGAPVVELERAWLAVLTAPTAAQLDRLAAGTTLAPEDGARLSLPVSGLAPAGARASLTVELAGPGVPGRRRLGIDGFDSDLVARLGSGSGTFPAGFDTWLIAPTGAVAALGRSTTVRLVDATEVGLGGRD